MADDTTTAHNASENRYEIHVGDELAGVIDYRDRDGALDMYHTGVEKQFGGRGLGTRLVEFALTDARDSGHTVIPTCPFIASFIDEHPDFADVSA